MKTNLMNGLRYIYDNDNYCVEQQIDDFTAAEVWYSPDPGWRGGFKIYFNGQIVHASKTFAPMNNKLNKLISKYHLELKSTEQ